MCNKYLGRYNLHTYPRIYWEKTIASAPFLAPQRPIRNFLSGLRNFIYILSLLPLHTNSYSVRSRYFFYLLEKKGLKTVKNILLDRSDSCRLLFTRLILISLPITIVKILVKSHDQHRSKIPSVLGKVPLFFQKIHNFYIIKNLNKLLFVYLSIVHFE